MNRLTVLLVITFIESFATICVERGVYFFTKEPALGFSNIQNLWLAMIFGAAYAGGALLSHPLCRRVRARQVLLGCLWAQALAHVALALWWRRPDFIFTGTVTLGLINGLKWPVIESYTMAGLPPKRAAAVVGYFNVAWALPVPLALAAAGPIIASARPEMLFVLPAVLNAASMVLCMRLEHRPVLLAEDHLRRPSPDLLAYLRSILVGSRWLLLASYATMWVLAALLPDIFRRLGTAVSEGSGLSGLLDVVRLAAFVALQFYTGWHYRLRYLAIAMVALPAGFFAMLFGPSLGAVLVGELVFGLACGLIYYSALYYAMVVKNASVQAGGGHEGLIGLGFAVGPAAVLAGSALSVALGDALSLAAEDKAAVGTLAGTIPVLAVCFIGALVAIAGGLKHKAKLTPQDMG